MPNRIEQTRAIKKALQVAGYPVTNVKHGTGTARSWIHIRLDIEWQKLNAIMSEVERLAAKTIGRESWPENCITVDCRL